jgi:hypothetical protein
MSALLHHQPGGLDSQVLDRLGQRLPGLRAEGATELTRTQVRRPGELPNRQRLIEVALRVGQRALDTVGFRLELQQCRKLRLAAGAPVIDDELPSDGPGGTPAPIPCSTMASARSMPAVIPAEVQTEPSTMKMRSSSTLTFGNRACNSRQCYGVLGRALLAGASAQLQTKPPTAATCCSGRAAIISTM